MAANLEDRFSRDEAQILLANVLEMCQSITLIHILPIQSLYNTHAIDRMYPHIAYPLQQGSSIFNTHNTCISLAHVLHYTHPCITWWAMHYSHQSITLPHDLYIPMYYTHIYYTNHCITFTNVWHSIVYDTQLCMTLNHLSNSSHHVLYSI